MFGGAVPSLGVVRFIIFVIDDHTGSASGGEVDAIDAFNERLQSNGNFVMAAGIAGPESAKLIDGRGGSSHSTRGSLFNAPNYYSGFWIIKANDATEAARLALEGSMACNRKVELRPFLGNE